MKHYWKSLPLPLDKKIQSYSPMKEVFIGGKKQTEAGRESRLHTNKLINITWMMPINEQLLAALFFSGFKYVIVLNRGDHFTLKPLHKAAPVELLRAMKCEQVEILDQKIINFAKGILPAFIAEDIFEHYYEDYVLPREQDLHR